MYRILKSDILRRKYYVYSNKDNTEFYVKTRKLFTIPKFIFIRYDNWHGYLLTVAYKVSTAKKTCKMETALTAQSTIQLHRTEFCKNYELEYKQLYNE